ncbi:hypothetical protein M885DRAFT_549063 [Pelagophyceae sp. CCMP2097]|nr:hypothetical protein M885DRAFT_549063 [Pelagophyceae sp. CCMP2097]
MANFDSLSDELHLVIAGFLRGAEAVAASTAIRYWAAALLARDDAFSEFAEREFRLPAQLQGRAGADSWRDTYRRLAQPLREATWAAATCAHGLGDRVAQPQLFVGIDGARVFNYGGWTPAGPQTDLRCVPLDAFRRAAETRDARDVVFRHVPAAGTPCARGGCQTLTPLWQRGDAPTLAHVKLMAPLFGLDATVVTPATMLVLAYGGGGGGYRNEHDDWRIGIIYDVACGDTGGDAGPRVRWQRVATRGQPAPRCAHSATYVPARLAPRFPEGCVVAFGGHSHDCHRSLDSVDVFCLESLSWTHFDGPAATPRSAAARAAAALHGGGGAGAWPRPRHGHTATLVEPASRIAKIVVVGGGRGNIIGEPGAEFSDACSLDLSSPLFQRGTPLDAGGGYAATRALFHWDVRHLSHVHYAPGRHHSASPTHDGRGVLLFGGGAAPSNPLCVLDARDLLVDSGAVALRALGLPAGRPPRARKMHGACCLLPFAPLLVVFGGWETNAHFDDLWYARFSRGAPRHAAHRTAGTDARYDRIAAVAPTRADLAPIDAVPRPDGGVVIRDDDESSEQLWDEEDGDESDGVDNAYEEDDDEGTLPPMDTATQAVVADLMQDMQDSPSRAAFLDFIRRQLQARR